MLIVLEQSVRAFQTIAIANMIREFSEAQYALGDFMSHASGQWAVADITADAGTAVTHTAEHCGVDWGLDADYSANE